MNLKRCEAFLCPGAAGHSVNGGFASRFFTLFVLALLPFFIQSCSLFEDAKPEPDNVSPTRCQLIAAAGGFICLYREGANPVDLLYVKSTANEAGFQVVFKIAESSVIPEALRKGWGDVAVGFTEAEAKKLKLNLRVIPLPRAENEIRENAGTNVILLRSGDEFLDNLLNPDKQNKPAADTDVIPLP